MGLVDRENRINELIGVGWVRALRDDVAVLHMNEMEEMESSYTSNSQLDCFELSVVPRDAAHRRRLVRLESSALWSRSRQMFPTLIGLRAGIER